MRMEKGGPVAESREEVEQNATRNALSTESLIQDSSDQGQLLQGQNPGSTVARDLNSTATSRDPIALEHPPSYPAMKVPPDPIHVGYQFVSSSSDNSSAPVPSDDTSSALSSDNPSVSPPSALPCSEKTDPSPISDLRPLAPEAYGGGIYGHDDDSLPASRTRASDFQSADGPPTATPANVQGPASTGDRDLDITGQSYIQ